MARNSSEQELRFIIRNLKYFAETEPPERSDLAAELAEHGKTLKAGISPPPSDPDAAPSSSAS
jgi:hypothetical protein